MTKICLDKITILRDIVVAGVYGVNSGPTLMQFFVVSVVWVRPQHFSANKGQSKFCGPGQNYLFGYFSRTQVSFHFFLFKCFIKITLNLTFEGLLDLIPYRNYHDAKTF